MHTPIVGQAYTARSVNAAASRMVNLFPETVPDGGKEPAYLMRAPGTREITICPSPVIRGMHVFGNLVYVVSGNILQSLDSANMTITLGFVDSNTTPVSMADNGTSLFIACGSRAFVYNRATGVLSEITTQGFPGAATVTFIDGYFLFNAPGTLDIYSTDYLGSSFDPLMAAKALVSTDNVVALIADHDELWVFKEHLTQVWYFQPVQSGFTFTPIQGSVSQIGCAATFSVAKLDNTLFWLGQDNTGQAVVYRANGYTGDRVSTHAIEWQIQQYATVSDAIGYGYQQDGHTFYVLTFPTGNATWVYDVSTQAWHERASFTNGAQGRHVGNCHASLNGENLIGDYQTGSIYALDLTVFSDNGSIQKWLRSWRALPTDKGNLMRAYGKNLGIFGVDLTRTAQHSLQLDCESGVGLFTGQGTTPQVMLRWSDDGGHTWSNEHWAFMGAIGEYGLRVLWRRLGMARKLRDRVYEVSGTDPVKIAILGARLVMSGTDA